MVEHSRKQLKILIYKRNLPVKTKYHNYNCFTLVQFNQNCSIVIHVLRINGHCHRNQIFQRYSVPVRAEMAVNQLMLNLITRIINIASLSLRHSDPQIGPQVNLGPIKMKVRNDWSTYRCIRVIRILRVIMVITILTNKSVNFQ